MPNSYENDSNEQKQIQPAYLQALYEAAQIINQSAELEEILQHVVEQAWKITGTDGNPAQYCTMLLMVDDKLERVASYPQNYLRHSPKTVSQETTKLGITGRAMMTDQVQLVNDINLDPDYISVDSTIRSELAIPIKSAGEVVGVINVEHSQPNAFDRQDVKALATLAELAAAAIARASTFEELKGVKGLVGARTALAWMGMASNAWRHNIEGDAVNIKNVITLLQYDLTEIPDETQRNKINARLDMIQTLASKILSRPITPPLSIEDGANKIIINDLIRERLSQLWYNDSYAQLSKPILNLDKTENMTVWVSAEWLRRAFELVIDNAVDAMSESDVQQLALETAVIENHIEIAIEDTGSGIPEEILSDLFGGTLKQPQREGHLGRGLLMVQAIMQAYGGDVVVRETSPKGTTMVLSLPIHLE